MDRFFNKKRKKSPEPPRQPEVSTNTVAGHGFRPGVGIGPRGEGDSRGPRIAFQGGSGGGQELPAPEASASGVVDAGTGHRNYLTSEDTGDIGGGENEPADASRVAKRARRGTVLGGTAILVDTAKDAIDGFGPLKNVLGAISSVYANCEETTVIRNKIEDLLSRLAALEARFTTRPGDVAEQRRRGQLIRKLEVIEGQLRLLYGRPLLQRPADHAQDDEDVFRSLEDLRETISDYQTVQQMAIHEQGRKMISAAEATILYNFRCAQGAEYRHGDRKGCLKGTRGVVLDEIELWTRDFDKPPVYWLNGLAGTGKSTIAQTIAERVFASGHLGASFFCSRDFEDRSNLQLIFPTLAVQLARRYPEFRSIFVPLVQSDPGIAYESLYHQMDKLIVRPLMECTISTVIIVDALDECKDDEPASAILSVLGQFVSEISKVKFFLTGRPESRIREGFHLPLLAKATDVLILHKVKPSPVNNDIRLFLKHSFLEIANRRGGLDGWPTEKQLNLLCERAAGLFIYAVATIKFVDNRNDNPRKRLDFLLQSPESSAHEGRAKLKTNTTLDSLYTTILQEAFGDDDPRIDPRIRSVLGAVILATNPLSPSTIATFLDFDTEDIFPLLSSFHSLLILQPDANHPIRPFHKSFPDFLVDPTRCINPRFHVSPPDHHSELVIGCLELMNRGLKKNTLGTLDAIAGDEADKLRKGVDGSIDPGLRYACESWHKHLVDANQAPTHMVKITSLLCRFLEQKFLFWLEVLSILGSLRDAVDALEVAGKRLEIQGSVTLDLVNDCFRFVTGFFEVISMSAAHIYHSALPLSPRTSIVRRLYKSYAHPLTRIVQGLPMSWDPAIVTVKCSHGIYLTVWSPCSRFIAIVVMGVSGAEIHILDAVTLKRVKTLVSQGGHTRLLAFCAGSRLLTRISVNPEELITWDLQTGVPTGIIRLEQGEKKGDYRGDSLHLYVQEALSITYSGCGTMFGVLSRHRDVADIVTYNILSRKSTSHSVGRSAANMIWTHNERIRFITFGSGSVTVWEVGFVSEHPPMEVESLPIPNNFPIPNYFDSSKVFLFFPTLSRLAFSLEDSIIVWDAQHSKFLLSFVGTEATAMTFSSDGRFFACAVPGPEVYLWKDSPTGYTLHRRLVSGAWGTFKPWKPLLSPDGQSILVSSGSGLQLWRTIDSTTSISSVPTQTLVRTTKPFVLDFSPDNSLAVAARLADNTVTILDLRSGVPRLTIDAGMKIYSLRVAENVVVVVGDGKIITWNLPQRDCAPNATANINDSIRTTTFNHSPWSLLPGVSPSASISPDFSHIAVAGVAVGQSRALNIYDATTGEYLVGSLSKGCAPWFTPDGREVWCRFDREAEGWTIVKDGESGSLKMEYLGPKRPPWRQPEVCPWTPSCGYKITDNGWILDSGGRRLLWLPPHWRSPEVYTIWSGRFLAFLDCGLPEAVILEILEE